MHIVTDLIVGAAAVICAASAVAIHRRLGEVSRGLHRLLVFLDGAHVEHKQQLREEQIATGAFHKTLIDTLRGCRDSIDAIRETTDELSNHRRETMEVKASLYPPALPAPEEPSSALSLPSERAQIAAGLSRPRSSRQAVPPEAGPVRTDPPPRSQTMLGIAAPSGPRPLPAVVPPPVRPRAAPTLPSIGAVSTPTRQPE